jgi:arylsulfatase A-like enzyme
VRGSHSFLPRALVAALAAAWLGAGCGAAADRGPNLILISIDTLRADRLGCYGAARTTSPALDAFAAQAVRFERAYAAAPWTLPSHVTMLSGLLPSTHGVELPDLRPGPATRLLAEELRDAGYYAFAHTDGGWLGTDFDLERGFHAFHDADRDLADVVADVRREIAAVHGRRPFFAFVHTFDVHCPYTPGEPYDAMFTTPGAEPIETAGRCGNPHYNAVGVTPAQARFLADRYDGGVRRADDALAGLFAFLADEGVLRDTVVVVTSDHGEELREHGRIGHEESVYPELLHVPLLVRAPGVAPRSIPTPVGLVDLAPTLLDLLGLPPLPDVDGRSLRAAIEGDALPPRPIRAELEWKRTLAAWIDGDVQLVVAPDGVERYDLARDPLAQHPLPTTAEEAAEALRRLEATLETARPRDPLPALPGPEALDRLRDLGYVGR